MTKSRLGQAFGIYKDALEQIEMLKKLVYIAAMNGRTEEVDKLRLAIRDYKNDIALFEAQIIEYKTIGEK